MTSRLGFGSVTGYARSTNTTAPENVQSTSSLRIAYVLLVAAVSAMTTRLEESGWQS